MARILIAYSSVDGHTRRICERLQAHIESGGHSAVVCSLSKLRQPEARSFDKIVIGASIRYGKYRPEVYDFVRANEAILASRPSAFFSVNVVARKPGRDTPAGNPYIRSFLRRTTWLPSQLAVFAGKIDYPKYGFVDRGIIRFIMWLTRGPTHPHACVEFTNWASVEDFAQRVSSM